MSLVLAVLLASLVGSPHCAGMCGGFVCLYGGVATGRAPHVAYNLGRLASYLALGAVAGAVGAGLDAAGRFAGIGRLAAIASGTLMVGWGAARLAAGAGLRLTSLAATAPGRTPFGAALRRARGWSPVARAGAVGLLTTLLPCGWLYAFVATAAGTGRAASGALVMLAFWLGTLPAMVALGAGVQRAAGPLARRLPAAIAAALVVIGLLAIAGRLTMTAPGTHDAHTLTPAAERAHGVGR